MSDFVDPSVTPAGGDTSVTPQPATPAAPATPPATQVGGMPPPQGGPPEGYVPSYRIREAREAAIRQANEQFAQREAQIRAEAERYKQQLHSLVGVTQPENPQVEAVKSQFFQIFPEMKEIMEKREAILASAARVGDYETQVNHYWSSYAQQTTDKLYSLAEASNGGPLSQDAKDVLKAAFIGYLQSSPERSARYERDPSIVNDFWRAINSGLIDPVRRTATATVAGRVPSALPQDTPGGAPRTTPAPAPANLDERAASAWAQYELTRKQ